jgi:hypothetical protein
MKKLLPLTLILLFGCATPTVVDSVQLEDDNLTCQELDLEIEETKQLREDALLKKGWTSLNIAGFIFRPLLLLTYSNVGIAINAADARLIHLSNIKRDKGCNQKIESYSNDLPIEKEKTILTSMDPEENLFWETVTEADNKDMYGFYLFVYPNGVFTGLAEERLRELRN